MQKLKYVIQIAALFFILALLAGLYRSVPKSSDGVSAEINSQVKIERVTSNTLRINNTVFRVDIANTLELRELGLSGRESLAAGTGMLFIFNAPGQWGFWMKGMNFPIDIIWLDQDFKPVQVATNVSPNSYPKTFYPRQKALYVLELPAGAWQEAILSTDDNFLLQ
jgi:hypothetical protein